MLILISLFSFLDFNPRAPCGARHVVCDNDLKSFRHFNPRAPCGARLRAVPGDFTLLKISIHAPRAGRDLALKKTLLSFVISIHAPRAGRDLRRSFNESHLAEFQSTRPVRGATAKVYKITLHTFATKGNS